MGRRLGIYNFLVLQNLRIWFDIPVGVVLGVFRSRGVPFQEVFRSREVAFQGLVLGEEPADCLVSWSIGELPGGGACRAECL